MGRKTTFGTYHALLVVFGLGFVSLGAKDCNTPGPQPPPQPDVIDSGSAGGGGAVVVDASPTNAGGSPGVGGATAPSCTTTCCKSCAVLRSYHCREGDPTAKGVTCEQRNDCEHNGSKLPAVMRLADLSSCTSLACVRSPGKGKRGVACEDGK